MGHYNLPHGCINLSQSISTQDPLKRHPLKRSGNRKKISVAVWEITGCERQRRAQYLIASLRSFPVCKRTPTSIQCKSHPCSTLFINLGKVVLTSSILLSIKDTNTCIYSESTLGWKYRVSQNQWPWGRWGKGSNGDVSLPVRGFESTTNMGINP